MGHLKSKKASPTFNRPSTTGGSIDRVWKTISAKELKEDDIVAGKGKVYFIMPTCDECFYVQAGESNELYLHPEEQVYAFVIKEK